MSVSFSHRCPPWPLKSNEKTMLSFLSFSARAANDIAEWPAPCKHTNRAPSLPALYKGTDSSTIWRSSKNSLHSNAEYWLCNYYKPAEPTKVEVVGGRPAFLPTPFPFLSSILPIGWTGSKPGVIGISDEAAGEFKWWSVFGSLNMVLWMYNYTSIESLPSSSIEASESSYSSSTSFSKPILNKVYLLCYYSSFFKKLLIYLLNYNTAIN